jgi:4-hydroxy-3-polyprenylbenzoate decarboxylase
MLSDLGDLNTVDQEVDTVLEIGAIIRRTVEHDAAAPLFTEVRGHPGFRVFGAPAALSSVRGSRWARAAISLGLDPAAHPLEIVEQLAIARTAPPVPPVVVDSAPCQENVRLGEDADLDALPIPLIHDGDGGCYVNTWGAIVVRSPDGAWTNWSIARVMKLDKHTMTGLIIPAQDIGRIFRMWQQRGEPMPFALAQGVEPAIPFVCGMGLPPGVDESGYLGAYFGEPIEVTRCVTVDLEVPATAEIVIEGHVSVDATGPEGPMGEYLGYLSGTTQQRPLFHVSAITHRDAAVLPVVSAGKPVDEDHTVVALTEAASALVNLRAANLPVTSVWLVPESAVNLLVVTVPRGWKDAGLHIGSRMLTRAIAQQALRPKVGLWTTRVMVVDDDIDPTDLRDVIWAFTTRSHPTRGLVTMEDQRVTVLHIFYTDEERTRTGGPKMAYDCLLDPDETRRPRLTAFKDNFPRELQDRAIAVLGWLSRLPAAASWTTRRPLLLPR